MFVLAFLIGFPPPSLELPTPRPAPKASELGTHDSAFPNLQLPALTNGKPGDFERYQKELHALFALYEQNLLSKLPQNATLLQKVQYEQVCSGLSYLQYIREVIELGRWDASYYKESLAMTAEVYKLAADLHSTPAGRLRCHEARILRLKEFERFMDIRVKLGNQPPQDLSVARFSRLQAEADLLKLMDSLKDKK